MDLNQSALADWIVVVSLAITMGWIFGYTTSTRESLRNILFVLAVVGMFATGLLLGMRM